jgi:hypothetical protein
MLQVDQMKTKNHSSKEQYPGNGSNIWILKKYLKSGDGWYGREDPQYVEGPQHVEGNR